ncbi:S-layer homology domain-containing protein [Bifidobacterium callitrichidarum]|nr:S-layer homology domain-containing protein [Bifidobacterium callitrichidarum]
MKRLKKALALIAGVAMAMSGAVSVAQADETPSYSVSNVSVSEIGAHTANVTFDWNITGVTADQIKDVCFVVSVQKYTSMTPIENRHIPYASGPDDYNCENGVKDTDLSKMTVEQAQAMYNSVYKPSDKDFTLPNWDSNQYTAATIHGQNFYRYSNGEAWDGSSLSGTQTVPVLGLEPNSTYGNTHSWLAQTFESLWEQGVRTATPIDYRDMHVGIYVHLKDGSAIHLYDGQNADVPDFTTTAEPAATTEDKLTPETKDNVTVDNGGKVEAGKSVRIYINNLKESCKADGVACFWTGYIYSTPQKLIGLGGEELSIEKDDAGKFYVDAFIPNGLSGDHKIALVDESGVVQGWTDVTVDRGSTSPFSDVVKDKTPHYDEILWLADQKITTGYKDGTFGPAGDVNRQDMAAFLYRLAGSPTFDESAAKNPFKDVNKDTPHYKEILWLASKGIAAGYTQTDGSVTFDGLAGVQRQDMAAFLHRLADVEKAPAPTGQDKAFTDVDDKTPHAEDIAWLVKTGVSTGYEDGSFGVGRVVIRQDMAAFLQRLKTNVLK